MTFKKVKLFVDNREEKLISYIEENRSDKIDMEVSQLDIADIVCSEDVGVERKEGFDFVISLTDNRLFEQLDRMKEAYQKPIIILEDFSDFVLKNVNVKKSSIYGAMSYVAYHLQVPIIPSNSIEDTVLIAEKIAYREQIENKIHILARSAPKGMDLYQRRCFILEGLELCGPEKAKILIDHFKTPEVVFKIIRNTKIIYTKTGNPKGISGPLAEIKGFSHKFIQRNQSLLSMS